MLGSRGPTRPVHFLLLFLMTIVTEAALANSRPVTRSDSATTAQGAPVSMNVVANDFDPDHEPIRLIMGNVTGGDPSHGTLERLSDTNILYTPETDFRGRDVFAYGITDGQLEATGVAWVDVDNHPPVAISDSTTVEAGRLVVIEVTANDTDADGDPISGFGSLVSQPTHGTATWISDTEIRYVADANHVGSDHFSYRITDGLPSTFAIGEVTVDVRNNRPPTAEPDRTETDFDTAVVIDVVANDSDPDGDAVRLHNVTPIMILPTHGTAQAISDSTIRYTPDAGFRGTDVFHYRASDGLPNGVDSASVTVRVDNQNPVAVDDSVQVDVDGEIVIDVIANDTDPEGDSLRISTATTLPPPSHGTRAPLSSSTYRYRPNPGFQGTDSFRYAVIDTWGAIAFGEVTVTVAPANQPPQAVDDHVSTRVDREVTLDVLENDSDPELDPIAVTAIASQPQSGTATRIDDRQVRYVPNVGFSGSDSFTYRIEDDHGGSDTGTVDVTVRVNPEPEVSETVPHLVRKGEVKRLSIHGEHLHGAQVYIGTLPPTDGSQPDRIYPTVQYISVSENGERLAVEVDARASGVEGFYNIGIETPGGATAAQFRVVGAEPVVDLMTPSQPIQGRVHVMQIVGENLAGADVVPMHPGVRLLDLDNSESHALSGLLFVSSSVPPGAVDVVIDGTDGSVVIDLDVRPDIPSATLTTEKIGGSSSGPGTGGLQSGPGQPGPEIYFQQPISLLESTGSGLPQAGGLPPERRGVSAGEQGEASRNNFCFEIGANRNARFRFVLIDLSDSLGDPLTQEAVNALLPGESIDFSSLTVTISGFIEFGFSYRFCDGGISDLDFCIRGEIDVMVPFVGGWSWNFRFCIGAEFENLSSLPASGSVETHAYTSSNACSEVIDADPSSPSGDRDGRIEASCCENSTISLRSKGEANGAGFVVEGPIFDIEPVCGEGEDIFALTLEEVSFLDDPVILKDTVGSADPIPDLVWSRTGQPGQDETNAVVYSRERTVRAKIKVSVNPPPSRPTAVRVIATGPDGIELRGNATIFGSEEEIELVSEGLLSFETRAYKPMTLEWRFERDDVGVPPPRIGVSSHNFYITLSDPDPNRDLYLTALDLGVGLGGASNALEAFNDTWRSFVGPANIRTWDGRPLFYYPAGVESTSCATDALGLLSGLPGEGQCGAFEYLARDAFAVNGLATSRVIACSKHDDRMLLRNWSFSEQPSFPDDPHWKWSIIFLPGNDGLPGMVPPPDPLGVVFGDMVNLFGLPGQNTPTPAEKIFDNHYLTGVSLPDRFLSVDPSYGRSFASPRDFETSVLSGVVSRFDADPEHHYRVRRIFPIEGEVIWEFRDPSGGTLGGQENGSR